MDDEDQDDDNGKNALRSSERAGLMAEELGTQVALDAPAFERLLPDLVSSRAQRLTNFTIGLATTSPDPREY
ncbi:hypothetical protein, partial [Gordonia paraffinivorans]|uniref:hypothetical protein n=1 Tax=Gordonia paraffinivorans TaxID=175628 RepID=UPI001B355EAC